MFEVPQGNTGGEKKPKGFYKFDQKIIEEGRVDSRYETDNGFRMAIDMKALINEVIRMAPLENEYNNDAVIKELILEIEQFEKNHNIELKGVTVCLNDMLDSDMGEKRKKFYSELVGYVSGINTGMDIIIGKIKEGE
jgi:hypothetical protein